MKILLLTLSDGTPTELTNTFVVEYDPTVLMEDGGYDGGLLRTTRDPSKAKEFADIQAVQECWMQSYGLREDGEPNRPLTAYNVQVCQ